MSRTSGLHDGISGDHAGLMASRLAPTAAMLSQIACTAEDSCGSRLRREGASHLATRLSVKHEQRIIAELRFKLAGWHRPAEQIALNLITTMLTQEVQLLVGFHALGDHRQVQAVSHGDDRPGNLRILFTGRQAIDKRTVDFQHVDRELLEVVER